MSLVPGISNPNIAAFSVDVLFDLGTPLSPLLLFGGATGWLFNNLPLFQKWVSAFRSSNANRAGNRHDTGNHYELPIRRKKWRWNS